MIVVFPDHTHLLFLKKKLGKEIQCHITKRLVHSFSVNIRISLPSKVMFTVLGLTNPDISTKKCDIIQLMHSFEVNIRICPYVNLKRMHQLYNVTFLGRDVPRSLLVVFISNSLFIL